MADREGRHAEQPQEIGGRGWKQIALRTKEQFKSDNVTVLAAGVAFYLLLALAPALVAVLAIYGLVSDPAEVGSHIDEFSAALPADMRNLLEEQLRTAADASPSELGVGLVVGVAAAILGASKGARSLVQAINVAYDEEETRGFLKLRILGLAITAVGLVVIVIALGSLTVLPAIGERLGDGGRLIASIVRWPLMALVGVAGLAALYRYAPDRDDARWQWVTPGALAAVVIWLLGSVAFTIYADQFSSFGETYGALGAVVVLMLWLFLTAMAILVGAEINGEAERQTVEDTTTGTSRALGQRDAYAADTIGPDPKSQDADAKSEAREPTRT
jgi:membrane protein